MLIKDSSLTPNTLQVIRHQMTEKPNPMLEMSNNHGTYLCRACGLALFRTAMQFHSFCGWPSFDEIIKNTVHTQPDADGLRVEIHCARCSGHLGHVFEGEGFTTKNTRYCVNAISLDFVEDSTVLDTEEAIVAGGCFWGIQYHFSQLPGVIKTEVGYIGGKMDFPSYERVCNANTGHFEGVRIVYDPSIMDYKRIIQYFFEIHDPSQANGQGPDIGSQYLSAIFYYDDTQKQIAKENSLLLEQKGYDVRTQLLPITTFWPAEQYHQNYYVKNKNAPYCHVYTKRF